MKKIFALCVLLSSTLTFAVDLKTVFVDRNACFLLVNLKTMKTVLEHNPKRCKVRFSPYSSFKIPASLMAFEKGVFKDENQVIRWDGVKRERVEINQDLTPMTFMGNSAKWVTEWIMPQLGPGTIQTFLKTFRYGNQDFSGGLQTAWVSSTLKISAVEQVEFLTRFWTNDLGVSDRAADLTKKVMFIRKLNGNREVYGKTGTGCLTPGCMKTSGKMLGWFVGILRAPQGEYAFAGNGTDLKNQTLPGGLRMREATMQILQELKLSP